jgi:hypothetical protein
MTTNSENTSARRLEDHLPEAKIDWSKPEAPAVPLSSTAGAARQGGNTSLAELIADDSYAMTFQSMGQYRTALLEAARAIPPLTAPAPTDELRTFLTEMTQSGKDMNGSHWIPRAAKLLASLEAAPAPQQSEKHLPGWDRGIATVTLSGHQLREAMDFINPDGEGDPDQLDDELTFGIVQHKDDDGKESTGMCCWSGDTDGVLPLDGGYEARAKAAPAAPVQTAPWLDGEPPHPWNQEWFIAETIYGDRVVLKALPEDHTYDYKTADETYMAARNIKRWMQFPDSEYVAPDAPVQAEQAQAEPVAWMNPETLDVIHDTRKRAWESDFGMGGKAKAAGYTCRLVAPALPAQAEQVEAVRAAEWISVDDRLPEPGAWCNVLVDRELGDFFDRLNKPRYDVYSAQLRDIDSEGYASWQRWKMSDGGPMGSLTMVSHWMPLPAAPSTTPSNDTTQSKE